MTSTSTSTPTRPGMAATAAATRPDHAELRYRFDVVLADFLRGQVAALGLVGDELTPVADAVVELVLGGGKRLRPAFAYWGWRGAGGALAQEDSVVHAVSCLELLQAGALIHDDVMDRSDIRRGSAAVHRRFASLHQRSGWAGSADSFGIAVAILAGDLCLSWSDALLDRAGESPRAAGQLAADPLVADPLPADPLPADRLRRAKGVFHEMRTELMAGQYLDVLEQALGERSGQRASGRALRIARYKSGKYTVERPLQLGAALAGAPAWVTEAYSAYGLPLGEAFQLRDDVLGVFGDPAETGKPAGGDLREGKRTVLVALALERAGRRQRSALRRWLGDPALSQGGIEALRGIIIEAGALAEIERMIDARTTQALLALDSAALPADAQTVLRELALASTRRQV